DDYRDALDEGNHVVKSLVREPNKSLFVDWSPYVGHQVEDDWDTGYPLKKLQDLANRLETVPEGVVLQRQVKKILEDRRKMTAGAMSINWGYGETLAYASLL
ncbi:MAG TPA: 2-oxoglutarate dehydrogenase E1 component, partial [Alcanivorax sp.]|nr:2-oxoglutarate dehydrogenase E1 component [Alcanivorax sp.]